MTRPSILVMLDYYLPSYKAGGPIRSIANLIETLRDEYRFSVLTRDRDLGETTPLEGIRTGSWISRDHHDVRYLAPQRFFPGGILRALRGRSYDLIYLNSFFSAFTVSTLLLRRLGLLGGRPVVIAPRGELALNAVRLKSGKKSLYIRLAGLLGLYRGVVWHASSDREKREIERFDRGTIVVAPNLPAPIPGDAHLAPRPSKRPGAARFVFLGRVSRMKNLDYALRILDDAPGEVTFDIYGTEEDPVYMAECRALMDRLPPNVTCTFRGPIVPERVHETLSGYEFFLMPTRRENFGHVILEAFLARLPTVISDETIWRDLEDRGAGFDLPLADEAAFRAAIRTCVTMDGEAYSRTSGAARAFGEAYVRDPSRLEQVRQVFRTALGGAS